MNYKPERKYEFDFTTITVVDGLILNQFFFTQGAALYNPMGFLTLLSKYGNLKRPEDILWVDFEDIFKDALYDWMTLNQEKEQGILDDGSYDQERLDFGRPDGSDTLSGTKRGNRS